MNNLKFKWLVFFIFLMSSTPFVVSAQENREIIWNFTRSDTGYFFNGSFKLIADPACVLNLCFEYDHIRALAPDAQAVTLEDMGPCWNRIAYVYRKYYIFRNKSLWNRVLDTTKQRVDFTLLSSINNLSVMPVMISSSGYYKVSSRNDTTTVEYYQQCRLRGAPLTSFYMKKAEEEALHFMQRFYEYAVAHCGHIVLSDIHDQQTANE